MNERLLGRFAVVRPLGRGGVGEVDLVRDVAAGSQYVLKRLRPDAVSDPGALAREFELLAQFRHPAVVEVIELGYAPDGAAWYTMPFVPGLAADVALRAHPEWFPAVAVELAHGLEALHAAGIVHGDLKPSNVLVISPATDEETASSADPLPAAVRILDFGVAAHLKEQVGTAGFAAPEVVRGAVPTTASDLYGLGATLYSLVAGRGAFEGATAPERLRHQAAGLPTTSPLEEASAPPGLVPLILRLMAPRPDQRPRDAREVRQELQRCFPGARRPLAERLGTFVLAGRERELAQVETWARSGRSRILLVLGEPGVGQTSVFNAFAARSALAGRSVIRVDGTVAGGSASLLQALLRQLARVAHEDPGGVEKLVEDAALREVAGEPTLLDGIEQAALSRARSIGRNAEPLILMADHAERLDPTTLALLRRLALGSAGSLRLLLGRSGSGAISTDEKPLQLAGELAVLTLQPLERIGANALVDARLGQAAPGALVASIWSLAAGHPGLSVELLRVAAATGALLEDESGLRVDVERLEALAVPASFTASRQERLAGAPAAAQTIALALAVCGGGASRTGLASLAPEASAEGIESLAAIGLIRIDASGVIQLSPPGLVASVLGQAEPSRRAQFHRAALSLGGLDATSRFRHLVAADDPEAALQCADEAWSENPNQAPASLAAELAESIAHPEAATWHDRAAERNWAHGRYEAAATGLERALTLRPADSAAASRWERTASAYYRAGRLADAERATHCGLALDPSSELRGRLLVTDAACRHAAGDPRAAAAVAEEALRLCAGAGDSEGEAHAALTAGAALLALDRASEAESMSDHARSCYQRCNHELGHSRALQLRGLVQRRRGQSAEALHSYGEALEHARLSHSRLSVEEIHLKLAQLHGDLGHGQECREAYRDALRIALEDGRALSVALAVLNLSQFEAISGNPREALRLARRAIRLARAYRPAYEFLAWRALAQGLRSLGRLAAAQRAAEKALGLAMSHASGEDLAWCRVELCRLLCERRRESAALAVATREGVADALNWTPGHAVLELLAGRSALRLGDRHRAAAAVSRVTVWQSGRSAPFVEAVAAQLRAELALVEGRVDEATARLSTALERFEAIPAPHDRAMALLDMARLGAGPRLDGRAPVGDWARQAATLFAELGNQRCHRHATELETTWLRRQLEMTPWDLDRGLLEKVGRLLHALTNHAELTRESMQLAVEQFDAERGVLLVEDPASGTLEPVAQYGAEDAMSEREAARFSRRLVERVISEGSGVLVYDAPSDPQAASESVKTLAIRAMLCVPMFLHGRVVGAVYLDSRRAGAFGEADRRLLDGFAQLMAAALESSRATERLADENLELRREMASRVRAGLTGSSRALQRLVPAIEKAARSTSTVLLTGETGTGKDLVAKIIHRSGLRRAEPFVSVNCGSLVESMLESELFGIRERVATGVGRNEGRFQKAHRGTIFLDEIGDMLLHHQVKLLSVLTDGEVIPIGGDPIPIDVRVIAATNYDLEALVEQGKFRPDLFHRLNVIRIHLPPLRDRKGDIPELARHFASQFASRGGYPQPELAPDFLADLMRQDWPGNVRQLENYIERRIVMEEPEILHAETLEPDASLPPTKPRPGQRKLAELVKAFERRLLVEELRRTGGNQARAAKALGLTEPTFRNRLLKQGIASRKKLRSS